MRTLRALQCLRVGNRNIICTPSAVPELMYAPIPSLALVGRAAVPVFSTGGRQRVKDPPETIGPDGGYRVLFYAIEAHALYSLAFRGGAGDQSDSQNAIV